MIRALLIRGMLVGLLAGLLVFAFARIYGEPTVERAIGLEAEAGAAKAMADHTHGTATEAEPELVSRPVQSGIGLFTGVVVYAAAFGGLFALVFAVANGRSGAIGPRAVAALLAGAGFVAVYVVPTLKYPANPPSVGAAETIGQRTALYFIMVGVSVAAMVGAAVLRRRLIATQGGWIGSLVAAAAYLAVVAASGWLLPTIDEVPADFPAVLLWNFRVASFGMQAVMWATLGLAFGKVAEQALAGGRASLSGPALGIIGSSERLRPKPWR